ncbi:MAG: hypothetical protein ACJ75H_04670 [Thermoanaerobaculia bacterium]
MLSITLGVSVRRLLLLLMSALCTAALPLLAQEAPAPCGPETVLDFQAMNPAQPPVREAALLPACGAAGQRCCLNNTCDFGLVCNSSGVCRTPCGDAGQRCCTGGACNSPSLACNSSSICRTCGRTGDICCSGNTCAAGNTCTNGRCEACGGFNQPCCAGVCGAGLTCSFGINRCGPCGNPGDLCCPGNFCNFSTCNTVTNTCQ